MECSAAIEEREDRLLRQHAAKHERERKRRDSVMERRDYRHYQLGTAREFKMERRATETVEREARLAVELHLTRSYIRGTITGVTPTHHFPSKRSIL